MRIVEHCFDCINRGIETTAVATVEIATSDYHKELCDTCIKDGVTNGHSGEFIVRYYTGEKISSF